MQCAVCGRLCRWEKRNYRTESMTELDKERKLNNRLKLNVRSWERKRRGSLHELRRYNTSESSEYDKYTYDE